MPRRRRSGRTSLRFSGWRPSQPQRKHNDVPQPQRRVPHLRGPPLPGLRRSSCQLLRPRWWLHQRHASRLLQHPRRSQHLHRFHWRAVAEETLTLRRRSLMQKEPKGADDQSDTEAGDEAAEGGDAGGSPASVDQPLADAAEGDGQVPHAD